MFEMDDKVAFITGAAGGIGGATAARLAAAGAVVVCSDIGSRALDELVTRLKAAGGEAVPLPLEVGDRDAVATALADVIERHARLDILVNAHGVYHQGTGNQGPVEAATPEDWDRVMRVNLMGVVHTCEAALAYMKLQGYGRIVTLSSAAAIQGGYAAGAPYSASKAAVTCFMKCVAREGAVYGITANSVAPGQIDTAMTSIVMERVSRTSIEERTPMGRLGTPDEVAAAIAFLCAEDASFVTGQVVGVNGGMVMV